MSKRFAVIMALKSLAATAVAQATIRGFDGDAARPASIGAGGTIIGHAGDPGEPEVDLNPVVYHWQHDIEMEFAPPPSAENPAEALDAMLTAFGSAVLADRTLGGLIDWLDLSAPLEDDQPMAGSSTTRWAGVTATAHYSTTNPLGN